MVKKSSNYETESNKSIINNSKKYAHKLIKCPESNCNYQGRLYDMKNRHFPAKHPSKVYPITRSKELAKRQNTELSGEVEYEIEPRNLFSQCFSQDAFLSQNAPAGNNQLSERSAIKFSSGSSNYKALFESWRKLYCEVEESKRILDTRYEELPTDTKEKVERRYALFLKKFDRITSQEEQGLETVDYNKSMKALEKYTIKVKELFKYLGEQSAEELLLCELTNDGQSKAEGIRIQDSQVISEEAIHQLTASIDDSQYHNDFNETSITVPETFDAQDRPFQRSVYSITSIAHQAEQVSPQRNESLRLEEGNSDIDEAIECRMPCENADALSQASDEGDGQRFIAQQGIWKGKVLRSPSADALKRKQRLQQQKLFLQGALCQRIEQLTEEECAEFVSMLSNAPVD